MKIILAVDSSAASDIAIQEVAARPWPPAATVEVLTVVEPWEIPVLLEGQNRSALDLLDGALQKLRAAGIQTTTKVMSGEPKAVIIDRAAETQADLVVMATSCWNSEVTNLVPLLRSDKVVFTVTCTDLTSETSAQGEYSASSAGTLVGGALPASTALVVSQQTSRRFRGGHSRVYLPLGDDSKLVDDSNWESAFATAAGTAWGNVVSDT